jgi:hypothetical protein
LTVIDPEDRRAFMQWAMLTAGSLALPGTVIAQSKSAGVEQKLISSIGELRQAMQRSGQHIRMRPGTYRVEATSPDDDQRVFVCSGSNNTFDLRGVTIEVPTRIYAQMRGSVHSLGGYEIQGDNNTFQGARFENTGDQPPYQQLSEFNVRGNGNHFIDCEIITRGSAPYGYGSMFGIGGDSALGKLQKHSAMAVWGHRTVIESCRVRLMTFGHAIHMHGAKDTHIRNTHVQGGLRPGHEIYEEESGPAARFDYKMQRPTWVQGRPIPKDDMIHLTEDGIRAYSGTGRIIVENCTVDKMRGGIKLYIGRAPCKVDSCTVTNCKHGYSLSNGSVVSNCKGNAAFGPLLKYPRGNSKDTNVDLTLLTAERESGDHPVAEVTGWGHQVRIQAEDGYKAGSDRRIWVGGDPASGRFREETADAKTLKRELTAGGVTLVNRTPHPVQLSRYSQKCRVVSDGPIGDDGRSNETQQRSS